MGCHRAAFRPDRGLGHRHPRIGRLPTPTASTAAAATGLPLAATVAGAPVAGRVCQTGVGLVPQATETLVAYDEANRTLTYEASGMPAFVTTARNTWTVTPLGEHRTPVRIQAQFDTCGLLGLLGRWAILAQVGRTSRYLVNDLRHYVETGTPSPRKQRQLRRARQ